jgi:hypothetical protein
LIVQMISELRVKLALDLDPSPTFDRGLGFQSRAKVRVNYLVIGSSNASHLRRALEEKGRSCCMVFLKNWRIGRGCIDGLGKIVTESLRTGELETM